MTNPPTPTGGGMPKWLILLLVIFLVIILGCCGGFALCTFVFKRAAVSAQSAMQTAIEKAQKEQEAAVQRARENGGAIPPNIQVNGGAPGDIGGTPAPAGGNAPAPAAGDTTPRAEPIVSTKLPSNFPDDVPVYTGFVPTFAMADKVKGSCAVIFSGDGTSDKVATFYESEMQKKGWKLESNNTFNESTVMSFSKDTRKSTVSVVPDKTRSNVTVSVENQ